MFILDDARICVAFVLRIGMEKMQQQGRKKNVETEVENLLPDLTNPDELRKAIIAAELLNRKY